MDFRSFEGQVSVLGQVIERHYGVWHTKCYLREQKQNFGAEAQRLCRLFGYNGRIRPTFRVIDGTLSNGDILQPITSIINADTNSYIPAPETLRKYRPPTKVVVVTKFSPVDINKFRVLIRPSRPLAELASWDEDDVRRCLRLEIRCLQY